MLPGYHKFIQAIALKGIRTRAADIPSFTLAIGDDETLESISHGRPTLTQPQQLSYGKADVGGIVAGQSYFGVPGFGDLIPNITPGDIPYYGPISGGG